MVDQVSPGNRVASDALRLPVLFAERLRRSELLRLKVDRPLKPVSVRVHRNQPFELISMAWDPFLAFANFRAAVSLGAYDDSLAWQRDTEAEADVEVVSLDFDRYASMPVESLVGWFAERISELRSRSRVPILVTNFPSVSDRASEFNTRFADALRPLVSVYVCDVAEVARHLGAEFTDQRSAELKASAWSDQAVLQMARRFALQWIPAALQPRLKAIVVDLDNTLYDGVLGEDGVDGVVLTPDRKALQQRLVDLSKKGVFLAAVSKNDSKDVEALFAGRDDFPLRRLHLSAVAADWNAKADHIRDVAAQLRIGLDSILFVDDNPGELASVSAAHPAIRMLHALDASVTTRALEFYPGLFAFVASSEDTLRAADLAASQARDTEMAAVADPIEYLRSLEIELEFRVDHAGDLPRMADLSRKTNQFNTAIRRLNEVTISEAAKAGDQHVVAVSLRDKLSDSGTVAFVLLKERAEHVDVVELCISCRALGRKLEDAMIFESIIAAFPGKSIGTVSFDYSPGERNGPALEWLLESVGDPRGRASTAMSWDEKRMHRLIADAPCKIIV